ncbi:MAG: signal peptidase I [Ruminococcus sp.]|nr:signal peptidase I [Ruminococcus sp.]
MKKVLKIVVDVVAWLVLILALLITILVFSSDRNNGVANLFGIMPMTVESDSMKPTFKKGDLIFVKDIDDVTKLKKGDVITFWTMINGNREKNTHRIVEVVNENGFLSFVTRGDNNGKNDDSIVTTSDIIGKWTEHKISGFGKVMDFLRTKTGFFVCIIIPMAIFFLFELYKFIMTINDIRKPRLTEDDEEEIKKRAIEEYLASQKEKGSSADDEDTSDKTESSEQKDTQGEK